MTPHNSAQMSDIAPSVLMPGDPLRAKYIAANFLDNAREVTGVRNMLGFTGLYRGKPVTVMGSGMGAASAGLYSYELFSIYGVERIIRIGTAGGLVPEVQVGDIVLAMTASTDSNYAHQYGLNGSFSPAGSFRLLECAAASARQRDIRFHAGGVFSSDLFSQYNALGADSWKLWGRMGALVQDMETHALYCNAAYLKKEALSILTMTDSCVTGVGLPDSERLTALHGMFAVALDCIAPEVL
jgi:purine-nucleoside phosphorylase